MRKRVVEERGLGLLLAERSTYNGAAELLPGI